MKLPGLSEKETAAAWEAMTPAHREAVLWRTEWLPKRKHYQIEPEGNWTYWLIQAGRGAGKTRTGAEWIGWGAVTNPGSRSLVAAPTAADLRDTCFEGESGLLAVIPKSLVSNYARSLNEIILTNGSIIKGIPASEPERFRGPQWHRAWMDELAAWDHGAGEDQMSWDMIAMALRLGSHPRAIITTTPKPKRLIRDLVKRNGKDVIITTASTYDNLDNLAPTFREQILRYEGTKLGRQEIHAEILDPESDGVVSRSTIKKWPATKPLPVFELVLMSLDTAFMEQNVGKNDTDPSACSVWGGFIHNGKPGAMLLDCWEERLDYPGLLTRVKREMKARYGDDKDKPLIKPAFGPGRADHSGKPIDIVLIENKGSGISLRQSLASEGIVTQSYDPGKADKLTRLHIVSHMFAQGFVWVVESDKRPGEFKSWAEPLVTQVCSYAGKGSIDHDDLLDTTTQALRTIYDIWLRRALDNKPLRKAPPDPIVEGTQRRENPYAA